MMRRGLSLLLLLGFEMARADLPATPPPSATAPAAPTAPAPIGPPIKPAVVGPAAPTAKSNPAPPTSPAPTGSGPSPVAPPPATAAAPVAAPGVPGSVNAAGVPGAPDNPGGSPDPATAGAGGLAGQALAPSDELSDILEEFKYDPAGRRDPFLPYAPNRGVGVGQIGPVMPLQKYELEKLKLLGVMWDVHDPRALIRTPSGDVFTVHKDTRIGNRNGYVAQIRNGEIVVVEVIEASGRVLYQTRIIRVAKDETRGPS